MQDFDYYQIDPPEELIPPTLPGLLSYSHRRKIEEWWLEGKRIGELLYRATRDGFKGSDFIDRCSRRGKTLIVIKSTEGWVFGGYASTDWINGEQCYSEYVGQDFLFTLKNPHNISPTRFNSNESEKRHYCGSNSSVFASFGDGDLVIYNDPHQHQASFTQFPNAYFDTTGEGMNTFTGSKHFQAKEIEAYLVN
eukprot:TRINITY_DN5273_c0_g1_i3.p1 TRINITY_DN5273_c0_g1~~TRINITY_DN5273_c0_g1_i3.p1  ORF type:complete len:194 (+),score=44.39 TRINITY_DN5273_c0_g1_i3:512-1093(+)